MLRDHSLLNKPVLIDKQLGVVTRVEEIIEQNTYSAKITVVLLAPYHEEPECSWVTVSLEEIKLLSDLEVQQYVLTDIEKERERYRRIWKARLKEYCDIKLKS
jgi:hypothetical protein